MDLCPFMGSVLLAVVHIELVALNSLLVPQAHNPILVILSPTGWCCYIAILRVPIMEKKMETTIGFRV